jgi:hypothetical protein
VWPSTDWSRPISASPRRMAWNSSSSDDKLYSPFFFHFLIKGKKMTEPWDSSAVIDCAYNNESSSIDTLLLFHPIHQRESLGHRRKPPDPQVRADVYTVQHRPIYTSTPDGESHVSAVNHCEHTHSQRLWTRCWEKI